METRVPPFGTANPWRDQVAHQVVLEVSWTPMQGVPCKPRQGGVSKQAGAGWEPSAGRRSVAPAALPARTHAGPAAARCPPARR